MPMLFANSKTSRFCQDTCWEGNSWPAPGADILKVYMQLYQRNSEGNAETKEGGELRGEEAKVALDNCGAAVGRGSDNGLLPS